MVCNGPQLRDARLAAGMRLKDLHDATGVSIGFLSQLERGDRSYVERGKARAIWEALNVPVPDDLFRHPNGDRVTNWWVPADFAGAW
jgi:transcriptional regulator with XRE-family HTH domain